MSYQIADLLFMIGKSDRRFCSSHLAGLRFKIRGRRLELSTKL